MAMAKNNLIQLHSIPIILSPIIETLTKNNVNFILSHKVKAKTVEITCVKDYLVAKHLFPQFELLRDTRRDLYAVLNYIYE